MQILQEKRTELSYIRRYVSFHCSLLFILDIVKMIHGHLTHLLVSSDKILNGNCIEAIFLICRNASHCSGRRCLETITATVRSTQNSVIQTISDNMKTLFTLHPVPGQPLDNHCNQLTCLFQMSGSKKVTEFLH